MPNFPKKITVQVPEDERPFIGWDHFMEKIFEFFERGLISKNLNDLVVYPMSLSRKTTYYNHFGEVHIVAFKFKSEFIDADIEVRYIGDYYGAGQIIELFTQIKKIKVPKVVFT